MYIEWIEPHDIFARVSYVVPQFPPQILADFFLRVSFITFLLMFFDYFCTVYPSLNLS